MHSRNIKPLDELELILPANVIHEYGSDDEHGYTPRCVRCGKYDAWDSPFEDDCIYIEYTVVKKEGREEIQICKQCYSTSDDLKRSYRITNHLDDAELKCEICGDLCYPKKEDITSSIHCDEKDAFLF